MINPKKKITRQTTAKINCSYHVLPDDLNNFEDFFTALNRYARTNGLAILDKGQTMGKIMAGLKTDQATLKKFLKND